jgi:hypothetical protein
MPFEFVSPAFALSIPFSLIGSVTRRQRLPPHNKKRLRPGRLSPNQTVARHFLGLCRAVRLCAGQVNLKGSIHHAETVTKKIFVASGISYFGKPWPPSTKALA